MALPGVLKASHLLAIYTSIQRDFCILFGDASASLLWFIKEYSAFSSWCLLTSQDADCVRDMTTSEVWLLLGQPQQLHSGKDWELQLTEPGKMFLLSQWNPSIHWVGSFFQFWLKLTKICLSAPDQNSVSFKRVEGREYRADKACKEEL